MALPTRSQYLASLTAPPSSLPDDWSCPICLGPQSELPAVAAHNSMHIYHHACLTTWLVETQTTCPDCRQELFDNPTTIPSTSSMAAQLPTNGDAQLLRQIWGFDQYSELLRANDLDQDDADLVQHYLAYNLSRLRQRWSLYTQGELDMNLAYPDDTSSSDAHDAALEGSDGEIEAGTKVNSASLITALFASWWAAFSERTVATTHHPLATGLLFDAIAALKAWQGYHQTKNGLRALLRINLGRGFDVRYPVERFMRPVGWQTYKDKMIEEIVRALNAEQGAMDDFIGRALRWQGQHAELWRN